MTTFHSSLPMPESPFSGGGGERKARTEVLETGSLGNPGNPGGPVLGGRRRGPSLVREAPGVTGPKSPRGDERGRGLGCRGAGLAENTFGGGRQGAPRGSPRAPRRQHRLWPWPGRRRGLGLGQGAATPHILPFSWPQPICSVGFLPTSRDGAGEGGGATSARSRQALRNCFRQPQRRCETKPKEEGPGRY